MSHYCVKNHFILTVLLFLSLNGLSQRRVTDSVVSTPWVGLHYGAKWTGKDLAERYGYFNQIGFTAGYKSNRNWVLALDGNFLFGNKIRIDSVFRNLTDKNGYMFDENGSLATVVTYSRGFNLNVAIGKVFPVLSPNENSGIYVHAGVGYLQHKLRIETNSQYVPQVETIYKKGYDRFTSGVNFHQFLGYAFLADQGIVNFYGGFYIQEGLTYNRRDVFFDLPNIPVDQSMRLDLIYGVRLGWFVPIYKRKLKEYYYN